jgi:hypothetical protein
VPGGEVFASDCGGVFLSRAVRAAAPPPGPTQAQMRLPLFGAAPLLAALVSASGTPTALVGTHRLLQSDPCANPANICCNPTANPPQKCPGDVDCPQCGKTDCVCPPAPPPPPPEPRPQTPAELGEDCLPCKDEAWNNTNLAGVQGDGCDVNATLHHVGERLRGPASICCAACKNATGAALDLNITLSLALRVPSPAAGARLSCTIPPLAHTLAEPDARTCRVHRFHVGQQRRRLLLPEARTEVQQHPTAARSVHRFGHPQGRAHWHTARRLRPGPVHLQTLAAADTRVARPEMYQCILLRFKCHAMASSQS